MIRRTFLKQRERGFVLVLAMLGIMTLSFFIVISATTVRSSVKVGSNYTKTIDVFNIAEIGLAKARPLIEGQDFSTLLAANENTPLIEAKPFNDGTYEVWLNDNDDGDNDLTADADNIIKVTSIGTGSTGAVVTIETHLQLIDSSNPLEFPPDSDSGPSAALMCGPDNDIKMKGHAFISGCDLDYTDYNNKDCTAGGPAVVAEANVDVSMQGSAAMESKTGSNDVDENVSNTECDDWRTLRDQLAALPEGTPGVTVISEGPVKGTQSDCSNPQVFVVNSTDSNLKLTGGLFCGIFVVASNTSIQTVGNVTIVGMVLIMGDDADLSLNMSTGTANIVGQIVVESVSIDVSKELLVQGTADINFSSNGKAMAAQAMTNAGGGGGGGGSLLTAAWKETY